MLNADRVWEGRNRGCMWSVAREETVKGRPGYKRLLHEAHLKPLRPQIIRCQSLLPEGEGLHLWVQEASDTLHMLSNLMLQMRWKVLQVYLLSSSNRTSFSPGQSVVLDKTKCAPLLPLQLLLWMSAMLAHSSFLELALCTFFFFLSSQNTRHMVKTGIQTRWLEFQWPS